MSKPVLKTILLASIRENPSALREVNRQSADYLGLVDSIKSRGVLNAILVREIQGDNGEQLYGLVDGLHRYSGSLDAGLKEIPAQVMNMDDASTMEVQLIGNIHKIETKPVEYSKQLQKIMSMNPTLTTPQLAGKLNRSTTWLNERLGLTKLVPDIAKLVDGGSINLSNAFLLAKLPPDEQPNFADRAMSMTPQEFTPTVQARKKEIDTAKRQGREAKPAEFVPVPVLQKLVVFKEELDAPKVGPVIVKEENLTTALEGWNAAIKWALHLDVASVAAAREKDDVRRKQLEDQRIKAQAERARKRAEEAAQKAAGLQTV